MVLNTQRAENYQPSEQTSSQKAKSWKWEKRHHCLLIISVICLALWFLSPQLKEASWVKSSLNYLPMIGGLFLVSEQLLRLI